jgi:hypothetical protein
MASRNLSHRMSCKCAGVPRKFPSAAWSTTGCRTLQSWMS